MWAFFVAGLQPFGRDLAYLAEGLFAGEKFSAATSVEELVRLLRESWAVAAARSAAGEAAIRS